MQLHRPFLYTQLFWLLPYMTVAADHSDYLLTRICHELEHLPLTAEQKAKVAPQLVKYACFMDTDGGTEEGWQFPRGFGTIRS